MSNKHPFFGAFLVLCFVLCGVVAYLTMDKVFMLSPDISPITAMFWGFLCSSIVAGINIISRKKTRLQAQKELQTHGKLILTISIITSIGSMLWAWSMREATAGSVGLLSKADIPIALVMGTVLLNEKFTRVSIIGSIIALLGLSLIASLPQEVSLLVVAVILLTKFLYAIQSYLVKKSGQNLKGIPFTFWRICIMTGFLFIGAALSNSLIIPSWPILFLLFIGQLFGAYIGRVCYFEAHKYMGIGKLNLLSLSQPVILLLGAWLILDEPMPIQKLLGTAILLTGLFLIVLEKWQNEKKFSIRNLFAKLQRKENDSENPIDIK